MSEAALWDTVRGACSAFGRFVRVENRVGDGTPDVCYTIKEVGALKRATGWLELKHEDRWPAGRLTPITIRSLTKQQVDWHVLWALKGGTVGTLIQIDRTYLAVDVQTLGALHAGELVRADLEARAKVWGEGRLPVADLVRWLARQTP